MSLDYLIFMGRNLENKKKLTPIQIMNSVGMNNMTIVNSISIFLVNNIGWTMFIVNNAMMNNDYYE